MDRVDYEFLEVERRKDNIAIVRFNRPESLNALNRGLMREIEKLTEEFYGDTETRVVIFTGKGKYFSAGADLFEKPTIETPTVLEKIRYLKTGPRMIWKIYEMEQITIAAINGAAMGGGCCIATACDFRIGDEGCVAGFPEVKLGMNLSWISVPMVTHIIGPVNAKKMIILARNNSAETLLKWGFIEEIVKPKENLIKRAIELAQDYAEMPPIAAQMVKRSVNETVSALDRAIMHQDREQFYLTSLTEDYKEGIKSFFEKRKGKFKGN